MKQMEVETPTKCYLCNGLFWIDVNSNGNLLGRNADFTRHPCVYVEPTKMDPMKPVFNKRYYFNVHHGYKRQVHRAKKAKGKLRLKHTD